MTDPKATTDDPGGTPEGHTPEQPAADEYGKKGTPAGELSPAVPHVADAEDIADEHGDGHGGPVLGPIDWRAWGMSLVGVLVALVIAVALALPTMRL